MNIKDIPIEEYKEKYNILNSAISTQTSNVNNLQEKFKEIAEIREIIEMYEALEELSKEKDELTEIINEKDNPEELRKMANEEILKVNTNFDDILIKLEQLVNPENKLDSNDAIIEIRPGAGGEEASLFAFSIYRMYINYSNNLGYKVTNLDTSYTSVKGIKEVVFKVSGIGAFSRFKYESGVHRVQRVPSTESSGRIHTSTISVAVTPEIKDIAIEIDSKDLKVDVYRASGPGGQGVNTTDSAVRVTHIPTGLVVTCQDARSQIMNKQNALMILKSRLYEIQIQKQLEERSTMIKSQIGSSQRAEKIRTYNFPQDRLTDHRIQKSWHNLNYILEGNLSEIIDDLKINLK